VREEVGKSFPSFRRDRLRRLRLLEEENRKLKQVVATLTLDNHALKDIAGKNW
jgi:putative transposase